MIIYNSLFKNKKQYNQVKINSKIEKVKKKHSNKVFWLKNKNCRNNKKI